jgi:hypothetical protein
VDQFQREEGLASREAAIALLLDIGLKAVTRGGRRFHPRRRTQREVQDGGAVTREQCREARRLLGWTQNQLAEAADIACTP